MTVFQFKNNNLLPPTADVLADVLRLARSSRGVALVLKGSILTPCIYGYHFARIKITLPDEARLLFLGIDNRNDTIYRPVPLPQ